jgi:hypothetical protein
MSEKEQLFCFGIAIAGALTISVADHLIIRSRRARDARRIQELAPGDPIIIRKLPPEEAGPPDEESPGDESPGDGRGDDEYGDGE